MQCFGPAENPRDRGLITFEIGHGFLRPGECKHRHGLALELAQKDVEVAAGCTVEEALDQSGFEQDGYSVTVNGVGALLSAQVREGDVIALTPKVEGGRAA